MRKKLVIGCVLFVAVASKAAAVLPSEDAASPEPAVNDKAACCEGARSTALQRSRAK